MNSEIEESGRRITIITDCHIMVNEEYKVYSEGQQLQRESEAGNQTNIFVK
jgi:hypothetical protein